MTALLVAAGAFVGAPLRFWIATRHDTADWQTGTLVVNVAGSFLLGLLSGLAVGGETLALLGVGFCGGFTTYSALAVQTHGLGWTRGTAYAVITVGLGLAACALGFVLGHPAQA